MQTQHVPVMLEEVLRFIQPKPGASYIDGTLGGGGHTEAILERSAPGLAAQRLNTAGTLPTADEMGEIIAASAADATLPNAHVVVVGGTLESLPHS